MSFSKDIGKCRKCDLLIHQCKCHFNTITNSNNMSNYIYEVKFYEYIMYDAGDKDKVHRETLFFSDYNLVYENLTLKGYTCGGDKKYIVGFDGNPQVWENGSGYIVYVYQRELI